MFNILVAEDNKDLREIFVKVLKNADFNCFEAADGEEALKIFDEEYIDLMIADIMMPKMNGFDLTESLRKADYSLPVLMVTARDDYEALEKGFRSGTDDFMVKPVNPDELVIRVKALLRRAKIASEKRIVIGSTVLDYASMTVTENGKEIILPKKEFMLLYKFLSYPGKIFTRQQIMDEIWGLECETDDRTINTHINRLRERFSDNGDFYISTIRGLGYRAVKK